MSNKDGFAHGDIKMYAAAIPTPEQFFDAIETATGPGPATKAAPGVIIGTVAAGYTSGAVPIKMAGDASDPGAGSKGYLVIQPYTGPPAPGDKVAIIPVANSKVVLGKIVTPAPVVTTFGDFVEPGNTVTALTLADGTASGSTYTKVRGAFLGRPGRYRITGRVTNNNATLVTVNLQIVIKTAGGDVAASSGFSQGLTAGNFANFTLDMTVSGGYSMAIELQGNTGGVNVIDVTNLAVKYQAATAAPTLSNAAL